MDFDFSSDQQLVRHGVERFLEKEYGFERRRQSVESADGINPAIWSGLADLGVFALMAPEAHGGLGVGLLEFGLVMEALGRHLVVEPVLPAVILAGGVLARCGSTMQVEQWLQPFIAGTERISFAHQEAGDNILTRIEPVADGWRINGSKRTAIGAPGAARLLISAHDNDGGIRLLCIDAQTPGVSLNSIRLLDGSIAADIDLDNVIVPDDNMLDGLDVDVCMELERAQREGLIAACWEIIGAMTAAFEQTVGYVQQRVQFGKPLSGFQAVQHNLARMAVSCQEAKAAVLLATLNANGDIAGATRSATMAEVKVSQCADLVAKNAVQFHGGMGVSDELAIASYFRKIAFFRATYADQWRALEQYEQAVIDTALYHQSAILPAAPAVF